jgi:hypothetical protein
MGISGNMISADWPVGESITYRYSTLLAD